MFLTLDCICQQLEIPIAWQDPRLKEILIDDTNAKYFSPVEYHSTDDLAKKLQGNGDEHKNINNGPSGFR